MKYAECRWRLLVVKQQFDTSCACEVCVQGLDSPLSAIYIYIYIVRHALVMELKHVGCHGDRDR